MIDQPLVSVVIPTRNRKEMVCACIDSILNSTYKNIEVVVVDDASNDGTLSLLNEKFGKKIELISSKEHIMMVKSRNLGAKESRGKYVLFVDDDNEVDSKMIENLVECVKQNETYGIVGPKMFFYGDNEPCLIYQKISFWTGHTTGIKDIPEDQQELKSDGIPNVFMVKKEVLEKINYFDEDLVQTWTEPDFSFRANKAGYKTISCPNASTYHKINVSENERYYRFISGGGFEHKAYFLTRNRFVIVKRFGSIFQILFFSSIFGLLYPLLYSFFALKYKRFDIVKLYWLGFKDGMYYMIFNKFRTSLKMDD